MQNVPIQKKKIGIEDFQIKKIIGKGSYGDVFLVLKDNNMYAIKQIAKRKLLRQKKQYQALVERQLLRVMKHPGTVKLKCAFQDKNKLYFVMEYCQIGQFIDFMIEHVDYFTEEVRKFYVAQIVNVLQYLHSNGIAHRDVKPQNILLTKEGHLKFIDFGTSEISQCKLLSKQFSEQIQQQKEKEMSYLQESIKQHKIQQQISSRKRRSTFVGTSHYISPELLQQNICQSPSDLWALGCIIYQMYYLETPFKDSTEYGVFEKIKIAQIQFPKNDRINLEAIDLIKHLLVKNPAERLGSCSRQDLDFQHLKKHPYFKEIDIDKIYDSVPPDIKAKNYVMQTEETLAPKIKNFEVFAFNLINQQQMKTNEKSISKILIQGLIQRRQFPYYEQCYLRIYQNLKARIIKMQKPAEVEEFEIQFNKGEQVYKVAFFLNIEDGKFWMQLKDKSKEVFKSKNSGQWVQVLNTKTN